MKVGGGAALIIGGALAAVFPPSLQMNVPFLGEMAGWHVIFIIVGLPGLLLAGLIFLIPEPKRRLVPGSEGLKPPGFVDYFKLMAANARFYFGHHVGQLFFVGTIVGVSAWAPAFFARVHGWGETQIGLWLGAIMLWSSVLGLPLHGAIVDRLFQRGMLDIHMRYSLFCALLGAPFGVAAFLVADPYISCLLLGAFFFIISVYASLPTVSVQGSLPSNMRGKAASILLVVVGTGGTILGPLAIASITDMVFGDPLKVGQAAAIVIGVAMPLVAILFGIALKPTRERMAAANALS